MSNQNIASDLVVDLSVEEQQLLSGGYRHHGYHGGHGGHGDYEGHGYHRCHGDYGDYGDRYWW
jgi:hypothetical protein